MIGPWLAMSECDGPYTLTTAPNRYSASAC